MITSRSYKMLFLTWFVCTIFLAESAHSQTSRKTLPDQKLTKSSQIKFISVEALDDGIFSNSSLWAGYDLAALATSGNVLRAARGEFQSSDDYEAKRAIVIDSPVYGSVTLKSRIALVVSTLSKADTFSVSSEGAPLGYEYDPDTKQLKICWSGRDFTSGQLGRAVENVVISRTKNTDGKGINSFGAQVDMTTVAGEHITIASHVTDAHCLLELEADGDQAQRLLKTAGAVVFGKLRSPYTETDSIFSSATISSPIKIAIKITRLLFVPDRLVILDRGTRKVIAQTDLVSR